MKAVVFEGKGGPEVLRLSERPRPDCHAEGILVRVAASALNRADILQRLGRYPAPPGWPPDIPGLEYAGIVEAAGGGASRWRPGDRVMGLVGGGAQAEFVAVHESEALRVPDGMALADAAAIPESFLTAFDALVVRARLSAGERVLVHAAGSGLGTAAIQLARALGATVVGTSRTAGKLERARSLGLDEAVETRDGSFRDAIAEPVDIVLDVLGAPAWRDNLAVLAPRGRLVLLGFLAGSRGELDLEPVLRKRLEVIGTVMRARGLAERAMLVRRAEAELMPLFEGGALRPVIAHRFPMDDVALAHRELESNDAFGKIVLEWPPTP
ncbi:MAG TPA: NAD(P)H-quinone oxidoreductase [Gemmatimonadales bacterium]